MLSVCTLCAFVFFTCFAYSRQYEIGKAYTFTYEASVVLNEPQPAPSSSSKDVGFKVDLQVDFLPVWQNPSNGNEQIIELKVRSPQLWVKGRQQDSSSQEGFVQKISRARDLKNLPFYIVREGGLVKEVFHSTEDPLSWVNIKKGIASLFQYRPKDAVAMETDASGTCDVTYRMKGSKLLHKTKKSCCLPHHLSFFNHTEKVLGAILESEAETTYELDLDDASIVSASSVEVHILRPEARKNSGVEVVAKQVLHFKGKKAAKDKTVIGQGVSDVISTITERGGRSLTAAEVTTTPEPKECIACKSLKDLINDFRKSLSTANLGTQSAAVTFLRILRKLRDTDEKSIKAVLRDKKNSAILPQLLDIVAAAQTVQSYTAAKSFLLGKATPVHLQERFMLSLSLASHPSEFVIEDLLKLSQKGLKDPQVAETLVLTIASMTRTFANQTTHSNQKIISAVRKAFIASLEDCQSEECFPKYIRALKNLKSKPTIPILLKFAMGPNRKRAIYAMRAIQTMPPEFIDSQIRKALESILLELDAEHDGSVRVMAAEVLLRWQPKEELLKDLFNMFSLRKEKDKELNTLLLGHVLDLCEKNPEMQRLVGKVIRGSRFANYDVMSPGGLSLAFSRPLFSDAHINASFGNMMEISGGLLKRSNVDVFVDIPGGKMRLLSFGMFAGGLSMFGGEEIPDEEEANAGIEIALMESQLRPFIFFRGQGELMGHVWSGTASDRTTALQGSVLLQDHSQQVFLQSGLIVDLLLTGVVSYDFAGQIQISLWNRNAHSLVEVGAAVVIQGQARVDNELVQTMVEFNVGGQTQLNFVSDLDFSDNIMMCLQMVQPDFDIIDNVRKFEKIPGTSYVLRKYKRKSSLVPGKTYVMNRKNTKLCNTMFRS